MYTSTTQRMYTIDIPETLTPRLTLHEALLLVGFEVCAYIASLTLYPYVCTDTLSCALFSDYIVRSLRSVVFYYSHLTATSLRQAYSSANKDRRQASYTMKLTLQLGILALLGATTALPAQSQSSASTSPSAAPQPKTTSPGCGKHIPSGHSAGDSYRANMISDDGRNRSYLIHLPSNYTTHRPAPVVIAFHGRGKDPEYMEKLSQFSNEDFNPDAIAVYPQAIVDDYWHVTSGPNDISFTLQLITHLEKTYCIDPTRIYASGKSNGGGFTNDLACDPVASTRIAAFAPVSGGYYQNLTSSEDDCDPSSVEIQCSPGRSRVPILEFHGTADTTIPYAGGARHGFCLPTVSHALRQWADRDGLGTSNRTEELWDGHVQKYEFGSGELQGLITHYRIDGWKHVWPSKDGNHDSSKGTYFDAAPIIMKFFKRWSL